MNRRRTTITTESENRNFFPADLYQLQIQSSQIKENIQKFIENIQKGEAIKNAKPTRPNDSKVKDEVKTARQEKIDAQMAQIMQMVSANSQLVQVHGMLMNTISNKAVFV